MIEIQFALSNQLLKYAEQQAELLSFQISSVNSRLNSLENSIQQSEFREENSNEKKSRVFDHIKKETDNDSIFHIGRYLCSSDVFLIICKYLPFREVEYLSQVCKNWHNLINSQKFCAYRLKEIKPTLYEQLSKMKHIHIDWKFYLQTELFVRNNQSQMKQLIRKQEKINEGTKNFDLILVRIASMAIGLSSLLCVKLK